MGEYLTKVPMPGGEKCRGGYKVACLPACLSACLPACLFACLPVGGVQFLITFGTISYHMYSARILPYFAVFFEIRCILPYFESIDFRQI